MPPKEVDSGPIDHRSDGGDSRATSNQKPILLGCIALILSMMGVGGALFQDFIRAQVQPELQQQIDETKKAESETTVGLNEDYVRLGYMGCGFLALVFAIFGLLRFEDPRFAGLALAISLVPLAWEYLAIVLIVLVVLLALAMFFGVF